MDRKKKDQLYFVPLLAEVTVTLPWVFQYQGSITSFPRSSSEAKLLHLIWEPDPRTGVVSHVLARLHK